MPHWGNKMEEQGMTTEQFNAFLETLAKLIEATANTPQEAAAIIRQAKA